MTLKDYTLLAKAIAKAYQGDCALSQEAYNFGVVVACDRVCDALLVDNYRFDRVKFLAAIDEYRGVRL